jgi:non-heme chloroperoxidase
MPIVKTDTTITAHEAAQLERANTSIGQIAEHLAEVIGGLAGKPVVIGHSFGGLLAQILAGRGLAAASVAIDPAPFRGVPPCRSRAEVSQAGAR